MASEPQTFPGYLCLLTPGCDRREHSMGCQDKNKEYAEAWRAQESKRRRALMNAVIRGDEAVTSDG